MELDLFYPYFPTNLMLVDNQEGKLECGGNGG